MTQPSNPRPPYPKKVEPPREPPPVDGRVPPHDLNAEGAVLSAVMLAPEALEAVAGFLRPEHFYSEAHKRIFEAALELAAKGRPYDNVMIGSWLNDRERLAQVGGFEYLTTILDAAPAVANVASYARIVHEKARVRRVIAMCQHTAASGYIDYGDAQEFVASLAGDIEKVLEQTTGVDWRPPTAWMRDPPVEDEASYLVPALKIGPGRTAMIGGDSYTGKSIVCAEIALSIATGRSIFDVFRVERSGLVRWFNFDQSPGLAEKRMRRLARAKGISLDELAAKGGIEFCHFPDFHLDDDDAISALTRIVKGAKLCIIDALVGSVVRTPEKDEAMGRQLLKLMHVSHKTGCAFLVIHHTIKPPTELPSRKGGDVKPVRRAPTRDPSADIRGNRAIFGACDSVFVLQSTGKKKPVRVVHTKEPSEGNTLENFYLQFEDVEEHGTGVADLVTGEVKRGDTKYGLRVRHLEAEQVESREAEVKEKPIEVLQAAQKAKDEAWQAKCDVLLELLKRLPGGVGLNELTEKSPIKKRATLIDVLADLEKRGLAKDEGVRDEKGTRKKGTPAVWRAT